jgi:hypothetical protein
VSQIDRLRADLTRVPEDIFEEGDVIKWSISDHLVVAVRGYDKWILVSAAPSYDRLVLNYDELLRFLESHLTVDVMLATAWESV